MTVSLLLKQKIVIWSGYLRDLGSRWPGLLKQWSHPVGLYTPYDGYSLGFSLSNKEGGVDLLLDFSGCSTEPVLENAELVPADRRGYYMEFSSQAIKLTPESLQRLESWLLRASRYASGASLKKLKPALTVDFIAPEMVLPVEPAREEEYPVWEQCLKAVAPSLLGLPLGVVSHTWSRLALPALIEKSMAQLIEKSMENPVTNSFAPWKKAVEQMLSEPCVRLNRQRLGFLRKPKMIRPDFIFIEPRVFFETKRRCRAVICLGRVGFDKSSLYCSTVIFRTYVASNVKPETYPRAFLILLRRDAIGDHWGIHVILDLLDTNLDLGEGSIEMVPV